MIDGGNGKPPLLAGNSSYNLYFTNTKTLYFQWVFFLQENIRTLHRYKYEHLPTKKKQKEVRIWQIKRQEP